MSESLVHLVCGSTGAGKTTYARALAERLGAIRFSIDEWMTALFWEDSANPIDPDWAMERVERCYVQIWTVACQAIMWGVPVVLDLGFTDRASRQRFRKLAHEAGANAQVHFVDVPADERWRRVEQRNAAPGENVQLRFAVTREMFDFVESLWQPPTEEELRESGGIRIGDDGNLAFPPNPR